MKTLLKRRRIHMSWGTDKDNIFNTYQSLEAVDNEILTASVEADKLRWAICNTFTQVFENNKGLFFSTSEYLSHNCNTATNTLVMLSVAYRDSLVLKKNYSFTDSVCAQLNRALISAYEINFYSHHLDSFCQLIHESNFNAWIKELSDVENNSTIESSIKSVAERSKVKFDQILNVGTKSALSLYNQRLSTLEAKRVYSVIHYKNSQDSGFCDLTQDIKLFLLSKASLMDEYLEGLDSLIKHSYHQETFDKISTSNSNMFDHILFNSVPTLAKLTEASELAHSSRKFNNLLLDDGVDDVEKRHQISDNAFSNMRR